jgi:signal transduction histidine kinase
LEKTIDLEHRTSALDATTRTLLGSPLELESGFSNLITNAVKYTQSGGTRSAIRWWQDEHGAHHRP